MKRICSKERIYFRFYRQKTEYSFIRSQKRVNTFQKNIYNMPIIKKLELLLKHTKDMRNIYLNMAILALTGHNLRQFLKKIIFGAKKERNCMYIVAPSLHLFLAYGTA